ncbi:MAG: hypothetical protein V2A71_03105 [Candidatus Eisenbacteria bacterium]
MKRLSSLLGSLALAMALLAIAWTPAVAGDPSQENSCFTWQNRPVGSDYTVVCPSGDAGTARIYVKLRDSQGQPCSGHTVTASFYSDYDVYMCQTISGVTDANGVAVLNIYGSVDVTAGRDCAPVETSINVTSYYGLGIPFCPDCPTIPDPPVGCLAASSDSWLTFDYDGDLDVDGMDYSEFAKDWNTSACRSDFNADGKVDLLDWSVFCLHWLDACP